MPDTSKAPRGAYLIRGGTVLSVDPAIGVLPRGDVLVRDGVIVEVGTDVQAPDAEVIDASDMIVMPGLVETHFHMWSALGRNFVDEGYEYFPTKWETSAHYQPEDFYRSVKLGLVDAVNAGITTVHNWSHNTRSPEHADAELAAHRDGLIRARYSYGHRDLLPEDEPLDFSDIDRVSDEWFGNGSDLAHLVHLGVNLRGPDIAEQAVFDVESRDARERGLPISIHTMQSGSTKVRATELEAKGLLGPDFLLCHYLAATQEDRDAMVRTNTPLSFSVHSEMRLGDAGDPRAALLKMLAAGVSVSLSIDATSIAPINLFEAMHIAWNMGIPWVGTDTADLPAVSFSDCIKMATINGAQALGLADVTGSLTPGKRADLILIRKNDVNVAPVVNVEATVVRSVTPANVDTVISDGRILKQGGKLVAFDVERVIKEAEESSNAVRRRAGGRLAPSLS
ncbi:amidohydrolase family protein [Georgenia sp. SYP-B2076]|uniref:amidohydrolase family protein n=1 Tax=Georgenia sp. SYP-B2076 TaxID=2495881 RepID=UPI000F8D35F4|nr:amidohydrolase family protein [Georgenia sp. SYP-B2076]